MSQTHLEIQAIAVLVAASCALPGVFLVLRRMALMSDAISHSILLGIVLAFFVTHDLASPFLILAAAATGVLTVALVELLHRTRRVKEDAAIGLVFPALFSVAVILISRFAGDVHLDTDAVLLGELAFAPFRRWEVGGVDLGPQTMWVMGVILLLNVAFLALFYKELKLATFDSALAAALGFSPAVIHYAFMSLVSVTAVGAFDAVGSILVVALMIAPPAAAYLLSDRLTGVLGWSVALAVASALSGYWLAHLFDASIAGAMATMAGVFFALVFAFAPYRGVVAQILRRARQRLEFAERMLAIHLYNHEGTPDEAEESREEHLGEHLRWEPTFARRIVDRAVDDGWVERTSDARLQAHRARSRSGPQPDRPGRLAGDCGGGAVAGGPGHRMLPAEARSQGPPRIPREASRPPAVHRQERGWRRGSSVPRLELGRPPECSLPGFRPRGGPARPPPAHGRRQRRFRRAPRGYPRCAGIGARPLRGRARGHSAPETRRPPALRAPAA